eukprot:UN25815
MNYLNEVPLKIQIMILFNLQMRYECFVYNSTHNSYYDFLVPSNNLETHVKCSRSERNSFILTFNYFV